MNGVDRGALKCYVIKEHCVQREGYFCGSGSPCSVSLNLAQLMIRLLLLNTCSSAAIAEIPY